MENTKIIAACRKAFTGFEKNDRTDLVALLDDQVIFDFSDSLPYGGRYTGKKEFLDFWNHVGKKWRYLNYDLHDIFQDRDHVLIPVVVKAESPEGIRMQNEHMFLFQVRDGKIIYGRLYVDTARARDILEGREPRKYQKLQADG